jgi:hypothetical protein
LPFSLIKEKIIWPAHCRESAENRYKCTNVVMEHDHIGHIHRPTRPNTNNRPHTPMEDSSDFDDELQKSNMLGLSPTESSVIH